MNIKEEFRKRLEKDIRDLRERQTELTKRFDESEDVNEVRSIGETLKTLAHEIAEAEAQLQAVENEPTEETPVEQPTTEENKREEEPKEEEPTDEPKEEEEEERAVNDEDEEEPTAEEVKRSSNWTKVDERNLNKLGEFEIRGGNDMPKEKREISLQEREERGKTLKEGRAVTIASDDILLPQHQNHTLATAPFRQVSSFVDLTKVRNLNGGESYEAPFTKSYGEGGLTEEGADYTEAEPEFGKAKINKVKITAYAEFSEELEKLPNANYEAEIRKGIQVALKKKLANQQIVGTGASNTFMGITATHEDNTCVLEDDDLIIDTIDQDTLNKIIFAYGGDEEVEQKGVLTLTKADLLAFSLVRNDIGEHAYKIDLQAQTINTVPYVINSNLKPLEKATAGDYVMVYGIPQHYETAIFSPVEIKKSYDYKFKQGMICYKASVFAGGNTTSYRGFMRIKKGTPTA